MAFQGEQSAQTRRNKWRSRENRERQKLSASVEAALADPISQEEIGDQDISMEIGDNASLIPPRLSMQSRPMPAIRPGGFVEDVTLVNSADPVNESAERKPASAMQNGNRLVRFAQRLTSSLAVFGATMTGQHENLPPLPPPSSEEYQQLSRQRDISLLPLAADTSTNVSSMPEISSEHADKPLVKILSNIKTTQPEGQGQRQRLAGRTTKIHLETAPVPSAPRSIEQGTSASLHEKVSEKNSIDVLAVDDVLKREAGSTSTHMPAVNVLQQEVSTASTHLRAADMFDGRVDSAARGSLAGSGVFENGQRDVVIANRRITPSSVVLVMLIANPGPVVVQYVSLQPQVGFTVHLTAPVMAKTPFNYVVLLGELF